MQREILPLTVLVLKEIAKVPHKCISEEVLKRAVKIVPPNQENEFDLAQTLVDYITEAGRLTDDVVPVSLFKPGRKTLCLKNTKASAKFIGKVLETVGSSIVEMDVSGTFQVDDSTVLNILSTCPELTRLGIRNCRKITDKSIDHILAKGKHLTKIDMGGDVNMTYEGINRLVSSKIMENLTEINLSGLPIQGDTLSLIATNGNNLTSLGIGYAEIGEASLRDFLESRGQQLEKLSLHWMCTSPNCVFEPISVEFLSEFLAVYCPQLKELDICGLRSITVFGLQQFLEVKLSTSNADPENVCPLQKLRAKFIGSSKGQVEQLLGSYPNLKLET